MQYRETGQQILSKLEDPFSVLIYGVPVVADTYQREKIISSRWDYSGQSPEEVLMDEVEQFVAQGIIGAFIIQDAGTEDFELWVPWR